MLPTVESIEPPAPPRSTLRSWIVSLIVHGLLAIVLWSLVHHAVKRESISLSAAAADDPSDVRLELAESVQPAPQLPAPATGADPAQAIDSLVSQAMQDSALSASTRANFEPASVEFFGTRAYGNRFVYILDISYSMKARDGDRFDRALNELIRSVSSLRPGQRYDVFLFCWMIQRMPYNRSGSYIDVAPGHAEKLLDWVRHIPLGSGTDPRRALALARQLNPDAVFLLSDGQFNEPRTPRTDVGWIDPSGELVDADVQTGVEQLFGKLPIHAIAFENPFTQAAMERIAETTGGSFRYVPTRSLQPLDSQRFLTALRHIDQRHRYDRQPRSEYLTRLSYAREFIADGELVYAEYLIRPLRSARERSIANPRLYSQIREILDRELGSKRLEDFQDPPELSEIVGQDS